MQSTSKQYQPQQASAFEAEAGRRLADRELLVVLAGEDIAERLSDDQITRLIARIFLLIESYRDTGFDDGWRAGIDHAGDYAEAYFAPKTKAH